MMFNRNAYNKKYHQAYTKKPHIGHCNGCGNNKVEVKLVYVSRGKANWRCINCEREVKLSSKSHAFSKSYHRKGFPRTTNTLTASELSRKLATW